MISPETPLIEVVSTLRPYADPDRVIASARTNGGLPKASRDLPYAARYRLKEIRRGRVPGVNNLEYRSQIGRNV